MVDYAKLKLIVGFVIILAFYTLMFAFVFMSDAIEKEFLHEIITQEEYDVKTAELGMIIGISLGAFAIGAAFGGVGMIIGSIKHEAAEGILDSMEGVIEVEEGKPYKYHIRSEPSQSIRITSKTDLLNAIEKSEAFYTLYRMIKTGINTFTYNVGDFLKPLVQDRPAEPAKPVKAKTVKPPPKPAEVKPGETPGEVKSDKPDAKPKIPEEIKFEITKEKIEGTPNEKREIAVIVLKAMFPEYIVNAIDKINTELYFYYRPILSIRRIDDPTIDDEPKREVFNKISGIFYLLPQPEDKYYKFPKRLHPKEEGLKIRKCYFDWRFAGFCKGQDLPAFHDQKLLVPNIATQKTTTDAKVHALARMTHIAVDADQGLREEIQNKDVDIIDLKRKLDARRDVELLRMLDAGTIETRWRKNFQGRNYTAIFVGIVMFFLGFLLKMVIV